MHTVFQTIKRTIIAVLAHIAIFHLSLSAGLGGGLLLCHIVITARRDIASLVISERFEATAVTPKFVLICGINQSPYSRIRPL